MEPASNVSVPFVVVMRICVKVPDNETAPPIKPTTATSEYPTVPPQHQLFPDKFAMVIIPCRKLVATDEPDVPKVNPEDMLAAAGETALEITAPRYPDVVKPPDAPS